MEAEKVLPRKAKQVYYDRLANVENYYICLTYSQGGGGVGGGQNVSSLANAHMHIYGCFVGYCSAE